MEQLWSLLGIFFLLISVGAMLHRIGVANHNWLDVLNGYTINCSFPILIFYGLIQNKIPMDMIATIISSTGLILSLLIIILVILFKFLSKNKSNGATWIIALIYGNVAFLGIPLVKEATGNELMAILLSSFHLVFSLFIGLLVTGLFQKGSNMSNKKTLAMVFKNPLLWSIILGVIANLSGLRTSENFVMRSLLLIKQSATPIILISIGIFISLHLRDVKKEWRASLIYAVGKMLVVPAFAYGIAVAMGVEGKLLMGSILQFSMPMAIAPFVLAKKFNYNAPMLAGFIVLSTLLVPIGVVFWSYIL